MNLPHFTIIKGVHPGQVLQRELKNRNLKAIELAKAVNEHAQTINAILKMRRGINPYLSIRLARYFGVEEDYFMLLQAAYDVAAVSRQKNDNHPLSQQLRPILFWDTDFDTIDWDRNKKAVIERVKARGNEYENRAIREYYNLNE